jgi:MFS family permease
VGFATASLVFVMLNVGALAAAFSAGYRMDKIGRWPVLLAAPILMAVSSPVVAMGVGTVLGKTLAQHDREDAEWGT